VPEPDRAVVYTDGSCLGNPGPGGWAWVVPDGPYASGAEPKTTNQRMEITAALQALRGLIGPDRKSVLVISDSTYVVNCFRQRWWEGWQRRNWKNAQGKPVANRDLWEPLFGIALSPEVDVKWQWVRGHSGDHWNEIVDQLALEAASSGRGTSGP